tara:strand:+ start:795 stop:2540 length:1746 start_codon:yes stop_codon:yes gene_type:complete
LIFIFLDIMNNFFKLNKLIIQIFFLYAMLLTCSSFSLEKHNRGESVSNYFSGILSLKNNKYDESYNFFKKLGNLEDYHSKYSRSFLETLINNYKINEAFNYSKKLKTKEMNFFQSDLVIISKFIKNNNFNKANNILASVNKSNYTSLEELLSQILLNWVQIEKLKLNYEEAMEKFETISPKYKNIKKINNVFLNCHFKTANVEIEFQNLIDDKTTDFSRYTFFYSNYLLKKGLPKKAKIILNEKLFDHPRNLLLNQLHSDITLKKENYLQNNFECENISNIIAELLYITANALSSQNFYSLSNFYINLAKYLNQNFFSYNTLLAENFVRIDDYQSAKKIYVLLKKFGENYNWYSSMQIALIDMEKSKTDEVIVSLEKSYKNLNSPNVYQTYDFAQFLKNNEKFKKSILFYSNVLQNISQSHELYPKAKDGRGIAYEQTENWTKAENDFLDSLEAKPNQAYVINYLAYSWIEKGIKIEKSLEMLKKANQLRSNDGYITDSLGWALYKLKRYKEAKEFLKKAVQLMPSDPIVNDHFADILWMNGKKLQARYYWKYVLNLDDTDVDLKNKINQKILNGPSSVNQ